LTIMNELRRKDMTEETVNIAKAKKHFSELLGQVAFGKKRILITKRGKPMARLVPADELDMHLCDARGWLENNDPFSFMHCLPRNQQIPFTIRFSLCRNPL